MINDCTIETSEDEKSTLEPSEIEKTTIETSEDEQTTLETSEIEKTKLETREVSRLDLEIRWNDLILLDYTNASIRSYIAVILELRQARAEDLGPGPVILVTGEKR